APGWKVISRGEHQTANGVVATQTEGYCDQCAPRMSEHHRILSPDPFQSFYKEGGLGAWSPDARARPLGISESGTIKAQDPIAPGKKINEATDGEILDHRSIAVEENHAGGHRISPLSIVYADPVALD